jgi:hypothetical protein
MPHVTGYLRETSSAVDPGFGNPGAELPVFPNNGLPIPPPGIWPPPSPAHPIMPLPPTRPDHSLPGSQPHPDNTLPGSGARPDNTLPLQPGVIWPPIPGASKDKYLVLVIIPGVGYRYVVIDASLSPDHALPGHQPRPDHGLPGHQPGADNTLPGGAPARPDQGLPPSGQPKK